MADDVSPGFDVAELEKLLMKAKSTEAELTFGFGLTAKPEDCVLLLHLRKPPGAMKKEAKSQPVKVSKACGGTVTVVDKDVRFLPEKAVKGMIKQLKKRFRDAGMAKFKPVLVGPDGAEIDEDTLPDDEGAELDDDVVATEAPPEAPPAPGAPADPALAALKQRLAAIVPRVPALAPEVAEKLRQACLIAGQQITRAETEAATTTIGRIEEALARQTAAPPPPPPQPAVPLAKLQEAMAKLIQRIRALPEGDARTMLGTQARDILGMINEGAVERAIAGIRTLTQDLTAAEGAGTGQTAPETPTVDPMVIWQDAKELADVSITALQKALKGFDDPDLQRIAEMGLNGVTDGFQTALMKALFEYKQSAAGEARAKAAANIAAKARELRGLVESDQIIALCENNPFNVAVSIRAPLSQALTELEKLAA
jgi:hypothetical protein